MPLLLEGTEAQAGSVALAAAVFHRVVSEDFPAAVAVSAAVVPPADGKKKCSSIFSDEVIGILL
jgi:hypothetical protein